MWWWRFFTYNCAPLVTTSNMQRRTAAVLSAVGVVLGVFGASVVLLSHTQIREQQPAILETAISAGCGCQSISSQANDAWCNPPARDCADMVAAYPNFCKLQSCTHTSEVLTSNTQKKQPHSLRSPSTVPHSHPLSGFKCPDRLLNEELFTYKTADWGDVQSPTSYQPFSGQAKQQGMQSAACVWVGVCRTKTGAANEECLSRCPVAMGIAGMESNFNPFTFAADGGYGLWQVGGPDGAEIT